MKRIFRCFLLIIPLFFFLPSCEGSVEEPVEQGGGGQGGDDDEGDEGTGQDDDDEGGQGTGTGGGGTGTGTGTGGTGGEGTGSGTGTGGEETGGGQGQGDDEESVRATLTYAEITDKSAYVAGYEKERTYTNSFGSWTICAYNHEHGIQLNGGKVAYIGTPSFTKAVCGIELKFGESYSGNIFICSEPGSKTESGVIKREDVKGTSATISLDGNSLGKVYIRSAACARISSLTVICGGTTGTGTGGEGTGQDDDDEGGSGTGTGSGEGSGTGTGTGTGGDEGGDGDGGGTQGQQTAYADYGWFELPAQVDKNHDGIDDENSDYYYSHTMRADATKIRNFSCCYSKSCKQPVWVAAPMHKCYKGSSGRTGGYKSDPGIKCPQTSSLSGYTRGHLLGSSDRTVSAATNSQVFYYSNIGAQLQSGFNTGGGAWNNLEAYVDAQWLSYPDTLYQVIGTIFEPFTDKYGSTISKKSVDGVQVPTAYYKALLRTKTGKTGKRVDKCNASELKCVAFIISHKDNKGRKPSVKDMYSIAELEELTGLTFFVNVPNAPKSVVNPSDWGF